MADTVLRVTFGAIPKMIKDNPRGVVSAVAYPAIREGTEFLAGQLALNTPVGATSKARQGVVPTVEMSLGSITGHVDYAEPASAYIAFVDQGTRAHWPPYEPIAYWARRVLGVADRQVVRAIMHAISVRGTKPRHFVQKTVDENRASLVRVISGAAARATARFNAG